MDYSKNATLMFKNFSASAIFICPSSLGYCRAFNLQGKVREETMVLGSTIIIRQGTRKDETQFIKKL